MKLIATRKIDSSVYGLRKLPFGVVSVEIIPFKDMIEAETASECQWFGNTAFINKLRDALVEDINSKKLYNTPGISYWKNDVYITCYEAGKMYKMAPPWILNDLVKSLIKI